MSLHPNSQDPDGVAPGRRRRSDVAEGYSMGAAAGEDAE